MTKREMLNKIMSVCSNDAEIVGFCGHEIELLDKKKGYKSNKPSKAQVANAELADKVAWDPGKPLTIDEAYYYYK